MPCSDDWFIIESRKLTLDGAREWIKQGDFVSAVGHESTAQLLSELLGVEIKQNRIFVDMRPEDEALAVQFLQRIAEGRVLSREELVKLYEDGKIVFRLVRRIF